jgi:putative ABC transport system permease protein
VVHPGAVVPHLEADFPEIESAIRVSGGSFLVRKGDIKFQEENTKFADSAFFHVFDFKMVKGKSQNCIE